jgi:ethanolamine utilization protein EutA
MAHRRGVEDPGPAEVSTIHGSHLDHDHDPHPPADEHLELLDGLERHTLHSVGIDIGSSTSHVAMSRLVMQRKGSSLSAEFETTERTTLYESQIWLTPYRPGGRLIDVDEVRLRIESAYNEAGIKPETVDTGAVVITGEALKKENAEQIASMIAAWSGHFVCVSAGPNHEAILAAHGSGSVALSERERLTVVNVDIGGGTTKISVVRDGVIAHVESVSVGARLLAFDGDGVIGRIDEPARAYLAAAGRDAGLGDRLDAGGRQAVADLMAEVLVGRLTGRPRPEIAVLAGELAVATDGHAIPAPDAIDRIVFSGGASEFLSDTPPPGFGDLGRELATAVRARVAAAGLADRVRPGVAGIRATVTGASQFSVQASGQTCFVSDRSILPVRGLAAVRMDHRGPRTADALRAQLARHDVDTWHSGLAAVLRFEAPAGYHALREAAEALVAVAGEGGTEAPLFVVLRQDLAHSLGAIVKEELRWAGPVTVVDGITVGELDHLDLGTPLGVSGALPVTVTSLEFPTTGPTGVAR